MAARKVPSASAVLEKAGMSFTLPTPPSRAPQANNGIAIAGMIQSLILDLVAALKVHLLVRLYVTGRTF
jgi:hypothetical protein